MHLAQVNVATSLYDLTDDRMAGFVNKLDEINALAERSAGFVWRLKSEDGNNAIDVQVSDDPRFIVNLSVWSGVDALFEFAYRSDHRAVMVQRRSWFEKPSGAYMALWWVDEGRHPSTDEALERLKYLDQHGPTPFAFTFRQTFSPDALPEQDRDPAPHCVGWS